MAKGNDKAWCKKGALVVHTKGSASCDLPPVKSHD